MSLFDQYMKDREKVNERVSEQINNQGGSFDERFWRPKFNEETKTGYAVVRFLPGKDLDKEPWVTKYSHWFKNKVNNKVYSENSLSTIGKKDPIGELNSRLWNHGDEKWKEVARSQKRKTHYYANVLVIEDPANRDAEGKVFIYRYGVKMHEKLQNAMHPQFEDEKAIKPFDMFEGANCKIKITEKDGWQNYDSTSFADPAPISEDTDKMREIFELQHDIHDLIAPDKFKSYEELDAILHDVVGDTLAEFMIPAIGVSQTDATSHQSAPAQEAPKMSTETFAEVSTQAEEQSSDPAPAASASSDDDDDEDLKAFFAKLDD